MKQYLKPNQNHYKNYLKVTLFTRNRSSILQSNEISFLLHLILNYTEQWGSNVLSYKPKTANKCNFFTAYSTKQIQTIFFYWKVKFASL